MFESASQPLPGGRIIVGYTLLWDVPSSVDRAYDEVFGRGSVVWAPSRVFACVSHNHSERIANGADGTLRMWEDELGLAVELEPTAYRYIADVRVGFYRGLSIGAVVQSDTWSVGESGRPLRRVNRAFMVETSLARRGAHSTILGIGSRPGIWSHNERINTSAAITEGR